MSKKIQRKRRKSPLVRRFEKIVKKADEKFEKDEKTKLIASARESEITAPLSHPHPHPHPGMSIVWFSMTR